MLIRTNWDVLWEAFSLDEGKSWRIVRPTKIEASSSTGLVKRLHSGRLVLFWNRLMPTGWTKYPSMGGANNKNSPQWSSVPASASREELSMAFSDAASRCRDAPLLLHPPVQLAMPRRPRSKEQRTAELGCGEEIATLHQSE